MTSTTTESPALSSAAWRRRIWYGIGATIVVAILGIVAVHRYVAVPAALTLRRNQIEALLNERAAKLNGLSEERVRLGRDVAALGETMYQFRSGPLGKNSAAQWEELFAQALHNNFRNFPGVVGGGIWYEPFVFDAAERYRGFYIQWVPPTGPDRNLQFTMEWSAPEAAYHNQDWYRRLIPEHRGTATLERSVAWTAPYRDPVTNVVMITVDVAMYDSHGTLLGMSTVDWNLDQISELIASTRVSAQSKTFLIDPQTNTFVAVTGHPELTMKPIRETVWATRLPSNPPREYFWSSADLQSEQEEILFSRTLENGLVLGFVIPRADIFTEVVAQNRLVLTLLVGTVLVLMSLLGVLIRSLSADHLNQLAIARDTAIKAAKLKSEFLANMSHEIRTPMNGVLGMIDLALEGNNNPESQELLGLARQSAQNLLRIINDILDFSKLEAGKFQFVSEDFSLPDLLVGTVTAAQYSANAKNITVAYYGRPELPKMSLGDPGRIRQILVNLIGNAIKFNGESGGVLIYAESLSTSPMHNLVRISVCDSGVGIEPEKLAKIFEAFVQGDGTATRNFGGTGLGLTISKGLAHEMGGQIEVRSKVGLGSVFSLVLPLQHGTAPADSVANTGALAAALLPAGQVKTVLVAEDNNVNQQLIKRILIRAGYTPTVVGDGQKALQALESQSFDVVLMDIQMPVMDGLEAVAAVRAGRHGNPKVPIIALTAHALAGDREATLAAGFDGYVTKPIDRGLLFEELSKVVRASSGDKKA